MSKTQNGEIQGVLVFCSFGFHDVVLSLDVPTGEKSFAHGERWGDESRGLLNTYCSML